LTRGIGWSAHLWMGSIVLAGVTGWLLSYILLAALRIPQKQEHGC
jgi:putative effector of murein hydrolase